MLALALLSLPSAHARSATFSKCSGINANGSFAYITTSEACTCLKTRDTSTSWWGGVDLADFETERPDGTCFENERWQPALYGGFPSEAAKVAKDVQALGKAIAKDNDAIYSPAVDDLFEGWNESRIISMDGGMEISNPIHLPPVDVPWIADFWEMAPNSEYLMLDQQGEPWCTLMTTSQIEQALAYDRDDDQQTDMVVVFENGDVWEIPGPIHPGEVIFPPMD